MFEVCNNSCLTVYFTDNGFLKLFVKSGYTYDGATIPFRIGKGDMKLLVPSLFHDIICENKRVVDWNRQLSSKIFYEALILCHVNKIIAFMMYCAVDSYQKLKDWKRNE